MTLIKIYLIVLLVVIPLSAMGQLTYPEKDGDKVCYNLQIEIRESYVSGICIMVNNDGLIMSSIVNEFGVSMIDFTYSENKNKVKIHTINLAFFKPNTTINTSTTKIANQIMA